MKEKEKKKKSILMNVLHTVCVCGTLEKRERVSVKQNKYIKVYTSNFCKSFDWKENEKLMMTGGKLRRRRLSKKKKKREKEKEAAELVVEGIEGRVLTLFTTCIDLHKDS